MPPETLRIALDESPRANPYLNAVKVATVVARIKEHQPGDIITYAVLASWLPLDPDIEEPEGRKRCRIRRYVNAARHTLERDHGYFLATIPKVGYRIMEYGRAYLLLDGQVQRARREIVRAVVRTNLIPIAKITDAEERRETIEHCARMGTIYGFFAPDTTPKQIAQFDCKRIG